VSKKKEEEKLVKEEKPKEEKPKETKKPKIKKEEKKTLPKGKLETLIDLVEKSDIRRKHIIVLLAEKGYLGQFYDEENKRRKGSYIEPTITEQEFEKIIGE